MKLRVCHKHSRAVLAPLVSRSLKLGVLGLRQLQNGDVGVGVFPKREKIIIGGTGFGTSGVGAVALQGLSLKRVGAGEAEMGERADELVDHDAAPVENFLELGGGLARLRN